MKAIRNLFPFSVGREAHLVSHQFGINVGVIDQHYKTITRLFLSENAPVEDSGQNPHRAIKI
jgi:hypothetical protein